MRFFFLYSSLFCFYFGFTQSERPVQLKSGDYYPEHPTSRQIDEGFFNSRYFIVQFKNLPDKEDFYRKTGIKLFDYLPYNSYYAQFPIGFSYKTMPEEVTGLLKLETNMKTDPTAWIGRKFETIKLVYFSETELELVLEQLSLLGLEIQYVAKSFHTIYVKNSSTVLKALALETIYWAEPNYTGLVTNNDIERSNHRAAYIGNEMRPGKGLTGAGITMGEWDGGDVGIHEDYNDRLTLIKKSGVSSHATHVCGTMAGAGNINPVARGMAPKAKIYSWDFYNNITLEMDTNYPKYGYTLTQNSYAYDPIDDPCRLRGNYDQTSTELDKMVEKYPNLLHVFAAGNSRGDNCKPNGYKTVNSGFQCAKNVMSVAAVTYTDGDASFSGCGPTRDGRIKPEVSAVGVNVYSTIQNNTYAGGWSGTSMACPGASGTTALIYEYYQRKHKMLPHAHMAKNLMANSADDIGNVGPDFRFGFGRINGKRAVQIIDSGWYKTDSIKNNSIHYDTIQIPKGLFRTKVMLCWNDLAATGAARPSLINDLDLEIIDSGGTIYKTWVLDTVNCNNIALRGRDSLNNIEQITLDNPKSGRFIIAIKGRRITSAFQTYSLTWDMVRTGIEVVFPNGSESFPPPSSGLTVQTIRWDANNIAGTAKIEYSINGGLSWQTITNSVPISQKYFNWSNAPDTLNSAKALVKISAGSNSDQSDSFFHILKTPGTIKGIVCDSQVFLKWPAQKEAVSYKLFQLIAGEMKTIYAGKDTFFTVNKLKNGKSYWFAISGISKRGAESMRTYAISFIPNSSNKPPKITLDIKDTSACKNSTLIFKTTATGSGTLNNFWQSSTDNGLSWKTLTGRVSDTLILKGINFSQHNLKYRRASVNACEGSVFSYAAKLEVDTLPPSFNIPADTLGCTGGDMLLSLQNLKSVTKPMVHWMAVCSNGGSTGTIKRSREPFLELKSLSANDVKNYPVRVTNACGSYCVKAGCCGTFLNVAPKLSLSLVESDTICTGQVYTLKPIVKFGNPALYRYRWQSADTTATSLELKVKPDSTDTYFIEVNDQNCSADTLKDSIQLFVRDALKLHKSNDTTICYGTSAEMIITAKGGNGNYFYQWSNGLNPLYKNTVSPFQTSTYYITLTDSCSTLRLMDSITIHVLPPLYADIKQQSDSICVGQTVQLQALPKGGTGSNYTIIWSDGQKDSIITVSPKSSKVYNVQISDACTVPSLTDSLKVNVWTMPNVLANRDTTLCYGKEFELELKAFEGKNGTLQTWWELNRAIYFQNKLSVDSTASGNYEYIAVVKDGCGFIDKDTTAVIILNKLDMFPKLIQKCSPQDTLMNFSATGGLSLKTELLWPDGKKGFVQSFGEIKSKSYSVTLNDGCSDTSMVQVNVEVDEFGENTFKIETIIDKEVTIKAGKALQTVEWDFGDGSKDASMDTLLNKMYSDYNTYLICRKQTDRIGCTIKDCISAEVINVMKSQGFEINIYPNPNKGYFNVSFNKIPGNLQFEIFDPIGQLIYSHHSLNYVGTLFPVYLSSFSPGVYVIKVTINSEVILKKVFLE